MSNKSIHSIYNSKTYEIQSSRIVELVMTTYQLCFYKDKSFLKKSLEIEPHERIRAAASGIERL
ncbi:hypothetical protein [Chryseobacterium sp. 52]|uniref:hypothetical protein n=1 Tax=Chryseobacterium sp. 52 TaxID=2035213 RepID=UPI000C19C516|nr:hypothetical protein [Chryseobacterium sp. 52]